MICSPMLGEDLSAGTRWQPAMVVMIREIGFETHEISKRKRQDLLMFLPHRERVSCELS
jgi:hypothetical protein